MIEPVTGKKSVLCIFVLNQHCRWNAAIGSRVRRLRKAALGNANCVTTSVTMFYSNLSTKRFAESSKILDADLY